MAASTGTLTASSPVPREHTGRDRPRDLPGSGDLGAAGEEDGRGEHRVPADFSAWIGQEPDQEGILGGMRFSA